MASIYEKALKRKDYSGITTQNTAEKQGETADNGQFKGKSCSTVDGVKVS